MAVGVVTVPAIHPPLLVVSRTLKGVVAEPSLVPDIAAAVAMLSLSRLPFITADIVLNGVFTSLASIV
jgi:hypothetical protein